MVGRGCLIMKRQVFAIALTLILATVWSVPVLAHPTKLLSEYKCLEANGWGITENQHFGTGTPTFAYYFSFEGSITEKQKEYIRNGANKWGTRINATEVDSIDSESVSHVKWTTFTSQKEVVASTTPLFAANSAGHIKQWKMAINLTYASSFNTRTAAHEFGHVVGLNDLYNVTNANKLMYGSQTGSASAPQSADIMGYNVITGKHSDHSNLTGYTRPAEMPSTTPVHRRQCRTCGIAKDEICSPQVGVCTTCGMAH